MTDLDLAALKALAEAATQGPWVQDDGESSHGRYVKRLFNGALGEAVADATANDAAFIAAARTALPALIARVEQAEAREASLRAAITELADSAVYADFGEYHPDGDGNEEIVLGVRESDLRALAAHPTKEGNTDE